MRQTVDARREKDRQRKNKRYAEDSEFREKVKARARAQYTPVPEHARSSRTRGRNKPRALPVGGQLCVCISAGEAADLLGVHKTTLRGYDDRGVIPQNRLVDSRGRRWYPKVFVELLVPIFRSQSEERRPLWRLRREVQRAWTQALAEGSCPVIEALQEER